MNLFVIVPLAAIAVGACSTADSRVGADGAMPDDGNARAESGAGDDRGTGVSFAKDVYPIVAASCALSTCHDGSRTENHWTDYTTSEGTYTRWVNGRAFDFCVDEPANGIFTQRTIVLPEDPDASFLMWKIAPPTDEPCQDPTHSRQMPPPPRPSLTLAQIGAIAAWIREGALQN